MKPKVLTLYGEPSAYLLAFKAMRGSDGIWSEENILKPKQLEEFVRRLADVGQRTRTGVVQVREKIRSRGF